MACVASQVLRTCRERGSLILLAAVYKKVVYKKVREPATKSLGQLLGVIH